MKHIVSVACAAFALWLPLPSYATYAAYTAPDEQQCSKMVDSQIESLKAAQAQGDKKAASALQQAEKRVRENRRQRVSDCKTWRAIRRFTPD